MGRGETNKKPLHQPFEIGGAVVEPGERVTVDMPVGQLYTHTELTMPVQVVHGRHPGPCLFVCAALHGDEINGVAIIRRLLEQGSLKRLRGTLLAVPVVNVHGFLHRNRYLPDRRDLNRSFPGSETGSLGSRLAHVFMQEIVARADVGIDLHTGSNHRTNFPQVRAQLDDPTTADLAQAFRAPILLDAALREGSLRQAAESAGAIVIVYEGGEALRIDALSVRTGLRGILSVMKQLGMLRSDAKSKTTSVQHFSRSSLWVRAPQSGILQNQTKVGSLVQKKDTLGWISDPFGESKVPVLSSTAGIVVGQTTLPLAYEGEALYHVARFTKPSRIVQSITALREDFDADTQ